jgi:hypothetical protein
MGHIYGKENIWLLRLLVLLLRIGLRVRLLYGEILIIFLKCHIVEMGMGMGCRKDESGAWWMVLVGWKEGGRAVV